LAFIVKQLESPFFCDPLVQSYPRMIEMSVVKLLKNSKVCNSGVVAYKLKQP